MVQEHYVEEIKTIFEKLPVVKFGLKEDTEDIRMINLPLFQSCISKMMTIAYYQGREEASKSYQEAFETTFK